MRFHFSAGEALPEPLMRRFTERFGGEVYDGIGSAEMFHIYCTNRPGDVKPGSLGRVVEGYQLKILAEDAEGPGAPELPPGEIGVLWVKGDSVAHGYFGDRDKAVRLSEPFMKSVIANLDNDWTLTGSEIDAFLAGAKVH